ncbi:MAG TPA: cation diffusion facilitator family transporter [Ktedonobacterales bacterium]|jgi:cation diffusion facilitator family transporter|nr:cation diffusion facilitator family transporter [Ktedonobacterales bacterium]
MLRRFSTARSYTWLSIAAALVTMALKFFAYRLTGSVGLLSDAVESVVNLIAALVALWALWLAGRPADEDHHYGHSKAEYFSSGLEGALILVAAGSIAIAAIPRLLHPQPLESVGLGLGVAVIAAAINGVVAWLLWQGGKRHRSITLTADARHLLTDVWTTVGVVVAVALIGLTGWLLLDPIIALIVALNVIWTGLRLLRESGYGLLDTALPQADQRTIADVLAPYRAEGIEFHALRTRSSGSRRFISLHVLVPGTWTVQQGHDLCERIELALRRALTETTVFTHLEPREDPAAWEDQGLDRQLEDTGPPGSQRTNLS